MKKFVLLSLLLSFVAVFSFSQSFQLFTASGDIEDNSTINLWGEPTAFIISHVSIRNISDENKSVLIKKVIIDTIAGSNNTFCWGGLCFSSDTYVSPNTVDLIPDEEYTEFEGHYEGKGEIGISTIRYVFFDEQNPDDSVSVIVNYSTKEVQGLSIADADGHICEGITINATDWVYPISSGEFRVLNFAEIETSVKVKKIINEGDTLSGTSNTFWWGGIEYDANTYESDELAIAGLGYDESFDGLYYPQDVAGISTINYVFFDVINPENAVTITINYDASSMSIEEKTEDILFSNAYPNPANNFVKFDYQFNNNYNNAKVVIYNLLGAKINETLISGMNGTLIINTGEMNQSVYFYSLVVDGNAVISKKLIVK
ncbi:MAG: T9SS type A sorting domain-containing protein [Bacteroidales bacterium]|nr:T9SS type A sorting domain-containing protein [Bacteroidales bacterium]